MSAPTRARAPTHPALMATLLAALGMLGPFSIDTLFPAFPDVARDLGAGPTQLQLTLSVYLLGFGAMALFAGPLSDSHGRRPVILASLVLFVLASLACTLVVSIEWLLAWRAVQGLAAAAGTVVGRAIVRDAYDGAAAQRLMSRITLIFAIAPAIAPMIGGQILRFGEWPWIFAFIALLGLITASACALALPETHPPERRRAFSAAELGRSYRRVLAVPGSVGLCLAAAANFGAFFLFISAAPAIVLERLGLAQTQFHYFFWIAITGILLGSQLSGAVAGRLSPWATVRLAYLIMGAACLTNLAYHGSGAAFVYPWALVPVGVYGIGSALAFPTLTLLLLDQHPERRGAASSLQNFTSLLLNALIASLLAPKVQHAGLHLALGQTALMLLGILGYWTYRRRVEARTPSA